MSPFLATSSLSPRERGGAETIRMNVTGRDALLRVRNVKLNTDAEHRVPTRSDFDVNATFSQLQGQDGDRQPGPASSFLAVCWKTLGTDEIQLWEVATLIERRYRDFFSKLVVLLYSFL